MDQILLDTFAILEPSVDMKIIMKRYLEVLPPRTKVLEVGVGNGWVSNTLHRGGKEVSVIDISPPCLKALDPGIHAVYGNIERMDALPYEEKSFDVILLLAVIEHLTEPQKVLQLLHRYLKPGGKIILSTPNINWFPFRLFFLLGRCPEDFHTTNHVHFWNLRRFRKLLEDNGFKVQKHFTSIAIPNPLFPFVKRWSKGNLEILNKYLFIGTELKCKLLGYNQIIIATL